jgi:hypothetical protein
MGPLGREIPICMGICTSLNISLIVFLSESLVREPPPCSLTDSPQAGILRQQSHWRSEGILFVYSFMYVCCSPEKGTHLRTYRKHIRSPSTTTVYVGMWIDYIINVVNLVHVSVTFCGHLQGSILRRILQRYQNQYTSIKMLSFKYVIQNIW